MAHLVDGMNGNSHIVLSLNRSTVVLLQDEERSEITAPNVVSQNKAKTS